MDEETLMNHRDQHQDDLGTIEALLERARIRIPNLLDIKERLLGGDTLANIEIQELHMIFEHSGEVLRIFDRHPELQQMYSKMASLYHEIIELALANERKR